MTASLRRLTAALVLAATPLLAACQGGSASAAADPLAQAQLRWNAQQPAEYRLTVRERCFCLPEQMAAVTVTVSATGTEAVLADSGQPLDAKMRHLAKSVADWFDFIGHGQQQDWHRLEVDYDPQLGYPTRILIDRHAMIADDENTFFIEIQPIP